MNAKDRWLPAEVVFETATHLTEMLIKATYHLPCLSPSEWHSQAGLLESISLVVLRSIARYHDAKSAESESEISAGFRGLEAPRSRPFLLVKSHMALSRKRTVYTRWNVSRRFETEVTITVSWLAQMP